MALRPILLLNVAFLVAGPPFLIAIWRLRDGIAAWKRPMAVGSYLTVLCVTVVELTGTAVVASYPRLAFALDVLALLAGVVGVVFLGRSWRLRRSDGGAASG